VGEGRRGAHGAAAREEAAALPVRCGRKDKGGGVGGLGLVGWLGLRGRSGPGGLARPAWPLGAGWAGSATGLGGSES
jgi:hypothetical protein